MKTKENLVGATELEFHAVANLFPMMTETERESLENDIKTNGLLSPIYIYDGKIIDGRNRYFACKAVGIQPEFKEYTGLESELVQFVISLNLHRRHLSTSQKACLAVELMPLIEEQNKKAKAEKKKQGLPTAVAEKTLHTVSKIFGVSNGYIAEIKKLKNSNIELYSKVSTGALTLQQAKKEIEVLNKKESDLLKAPIEKKVPILELLETTEPAVVENNVVSAVELSKLELKKVSDLVKFGMLEVNAIAYIVSNRKAKKELTAVAPKRKKVEFLLDDNEKEFLSEYAKEKKISVSELIRNLIKENIK